MIDHLIKKILEKKTPSVVGLDPRLEYLPQHLVDRYCKSSFSMENACEAICEFNKSIIDAVCDLVPAVKLQIACYEMYGLPGMELFKATADYAKKMGLIVIGDIKRSDIGSTAAAYSSAYLGRTTLKKSEIAVFDMDFVTVNPYFGIDGIKPFLDDCRKYDKGVFILVKTSNPSSGEIQDLSIGDKQLYEIVGEKVSSWGADMIGTYGYSRVGAVVGATYPEQLGKLRKMMPKTYFLVPGYGAQGGSADDILGCFDSSGLGAVINASRSVICAYSRSPWKDEFSPDQYALASRAEVIRMKKEIDAALESKNIKPWS